MPLVFVSFLTLSCALARLPEGLQLPGIRLEAGEKGLRVGEGFRTRGGGGGIRKGTART